MKITPGNQTLILASDRRGASKPSGGPSATHAAATGSVLSRVTIVATQPGSSVVYLQADYSPEAAAIGGPLSYAGRSSGISRSAAPSAAGGASGITAVAGQARTSTALTAASRSFGTSSSSYLKLSPIEQYAFTQRILSQAPAVSRIDAYA